MKLLPVLAGLFGLLIACTNMNNTSSNAEQVQAMTVQLPKDFLDFYETFHRDSQYQMDHIVWPLQGDAGVQVDSTHYNKVSKQWEPENWLMQRLNFDPKDYQRDVEMLGDLIVVERIRARTVNFGVVRRFAKQSNGEWMLIYYSDLQEISK